MPCFFRVISCFTGHSHGISTFIVPGAGEPNFDSFEQNPFSTLRQRRETEVQSLLTKLAHDTIALGEYSRLQKLYKTHHHLFSAFIDACCCSFLVASADSSFVGAIEKDSAELQAEHKALFETANAKDKDKKVCVLLLCTQSNQC